MTDYERGYRAGIEAAAKVHDSAEVKAVACRDSRAAAWHGRWGDRIRALSPPGAQGEALDAGGTRCRWCGQRGEELLTTTQELLSRHEAACSHNPDAVGASPQLQRLWADRHSGEKALAPRSERREGDPTPSPAAAPCPHEHRDWDTTDGVRCVKCGATHLDRPTPSPAAAPCAQCGRWNCGGEPPPDGAPPPHDAPKEEA